MPCHLGCNTFSKFSGYASKRLEYFSPLLSLVRSLANHVHKLSFGTFGFKLENYLSFLVGMDIFSFFLLHHVHVLYVDVQFKKIFGPNFHYLHLHLRSFKSRHHNFSKDPNSSLESSSYFSPIFKNLPIFKSNQIHSSSGLSTKISMQPLYQS